MLVSFDELPNAVKVCLLIVKVCLLIVIKTAYVRVRGASVRKLGHCNCKASLPNFLKPVLCVLHNFYFHNNFHQPECKLLLTFIRVGIY